MPGWAANTVCALLAERGISLQTDSIRAGVVRGVALDHARLRLSWQGMPLTITCREIRARPALRDLLLGRVEAQTVTFDAWPKPHGLGAYSVKCSTYLGGDNNPANDTLSRAFSFSSAPPPNPGWTEKNPMPLPPSSRAVKDGGWLAYSSCTEKVYAPGSSAADV